MSNAFRLMVRLTPRADGDRIDGLRDGPDGARIVAARVRAVPEKGLANRALEKLVAKWLDVPASTVKVTSGETSRIKTVSVSGDEIEDLVRERQASLKPV